MPYDRVAKCVSDPYAVAEIDPCRTIALRNASLDPYAVAGA
jgi:hypothetical protein